MAVTSTELEGMVAPHFEFPRHLTRRAIKKDQEDGGVYLPERWTKRGEVGEIRTQKVISTVTEMVQEVVMNEPYKKGSDLRVDFVDDFPIRSAVIEVKTSTHALRLEKQEIRDEILSNEIRAQMIGPWTKKDWEVEWKKKIDQWSQKPQAEKELAISSKLTETGRILVNAGEEDLREKSPDEIIRDSFFPQIERLIFVANGLTPEEAVLEQREIKQRTIWPWVPPANFTEIFPNLEGGELNAIG